MSGPIRPATRAAQISIDKFGGSVSMAGRLFTDDEAWLGGFYELALEVGPRSDERLKAALLALWSHPDITGCYTDRSREPADQPRTSPDGLESGSHLLGVARLPNGSRVACGTCLIREEDEGPDWLDFYLPIGSLGAASPTNSLPFWSESNGPEPWRSEVEDWLAEVGLWVARSASFRLGLIGFEVSGVEYAADIAATGIPAERPGGYLWPVGATVEYHRRNRG